MFRDISCANLKDSERGCVSE